MDNKKLNEFTRLYGNYLMKLTMRTSSYEVVLEVDKIISRYVSDVFFIMSMTMDFSEKTAAWVVWENVLPLPARITNGQGEKRSDRLWEEVKEYQRDHLGALSRTYRILDISPATQMWLGGAPLETDNVIQKINEKYQLPKSVMVTYKDKEKSCNSFKYPLVVFLNVDSKQRMPMSFCKKFKEHIVTVDPAFDWSACEEISYKFSDDFSLNSKLPVFKDDPCCISFLLSLKKYKLKLPKFIAMPILAMSEFLLGKL